MVLVSLVTGIVIEQENGLAAWREGHWKLKCSKGKLKRLEILKLKVKTCINIFCIIGFCILLVSISLLDIVLWLRA